MNSISWRKRAFRAIGFGAVLLAWAGLLGAGFALLQRYESTAAHSAPAPAVENPLFRDGKLFSLVIALHPHCPCSRATVGELVKIYSHAPDKAKITVLAFKPLDEPDSWIESSALRTLEKLSPHVVIDTNGVMATSLSLNTSGQIQLYSPEGKLLYNGGITAARGHSGDNAGESTVLSLLRNEITTAANAPTFGCSIQ